MALRRDLGLKVTESNPQKDRTVDTRRLLAGQLGLNRVDHLGIHVLVWPRLRVA